MQLGGALQGFLIAFRALVLGIEVGLNVLFVSRSVSSECWWQSHRCGQRGQYNFSCTCARCILEKVFLPDSKAQEFMDKVKKLSRVSCPSVLPDVGPSSVVLRGEDIICS